MAKKRVRFVIQTTGRKRTFGVHSAKTLPKARSIILRAKAVGSRVKITKFINGKKIIITKKQLGGITKSAIAKTKRRIIAKRGRPL